jgi:hypothetical protein
MNADNSTSFQDASQGLTGRIIKNLFVMREKTNFYNTLPTSAQALFQTGYGSNVVDIANFPVNSTIHIYSRGVIDFDASVVASGTGVFQLEVDDGAGNVARFTSNNLTLSKQGTANQNRFYQVDYIFQRTADNSYKFNGYGLVSDGSGGQIKMGYTEQNFVPTIPYTQFTIKGTYYKIVSTPGEEYIPLASVYINNLILDSSLLIDPPPAPTSHTALTDLTAGDAGHTQFALLGGRSGGQVLSGGITPANFLTLKSHTAGLNNIVVKDLNTTFEKDIDLDNNSLLNAFGLNTQFLSALSQIETQQIISVGLGQQSYVANPHRFTADGTPATEQLEINNAEISAFKPLNMNTNDITNANQINRASNGNVINLDNDVVPPLITGALTLEAGPGKQLWMSAPSDVRLTSSGAGTLFDCGAGIHRFDDFSGTNMSISGVQITMNKQLSMDNNPIINVGSINGLTPVGGLSSSTSNSAVLSASTAEQSILGLTSVGSRMAPANTFQQGDAYTATLAGNFSSNNGDTLTLRLKGGATASTVLSSVIVPLNASTNKFFELEINFVVRQLGGAGVADLAINYDFSYNQNSGGNFQGERKCEINNTNFDTTIMNQLEITAQFSSTSANNSIETLLSTLGKNY